MIPPCVRSETPVVGYDTSLCPFFWVGIPILLRSTWEAAPQRIPIPDPLARSWIAHSSSNLSPQVDCVCLGSPASPRWSPVPSDPAGVASTALIQGPESPMLHPPRTNSPHGIAPATNFMFDAVRWLHPWCASPAQTIPGAAPTAGCEQQMPPTPPRPHSLLNTEDDGGG